MHNMPLSPGEAERAPLSRRKSFALLALIILLVEVIPLAYNFVTPALPEIAKHFGTANVGWVITIVTLMLAASTPLVGKLGDIYGKKRMMLVSAAVFGAGSLLGALAPNFELFLVGRGLQGAGMAILVLAYGLIRDVMPPAIIPVAVGFVATGMGASTILGPIIGGYLIDHFGYTGVFWAQLIHVAVVGIAVAIFVPETTLRTKSKLDVLGAVILGLGAFVLLFGIGKATAWGYTAPQTLLCVGGGLAILAAWLVYERTPKEPLIDLQMLKHGPVAKTLAASGFVQFVLVSHSMLIPMFVMTDPDLGLGYGFGVTALAVAIYTVPTGVVSMIAGPVGGYFTRRIGPAPVLVFGGACLSLGSVLLATLHDSTAQMMFGQLVIGLGLGSASATLPNLIMRTVPAQTQGIAGGMLNLSGSLGSAIGSQVMIAIVAIPGVVLVGRAAQYSEKGFVYAFCTLAVAGLLAAVMGLLLTRNKIDRPADVAAPKTEMVA
ncbi:Major Facilitator Superfamily protein [Rhodococcus jostii]|uniref:Major Facilitator Superfamily protein n=2 Tax=Rhodococcus jostii TaxID=132919 RepID=A0A1H5IEB3_RHOJO|nr:Major Facilitator Superfamily protein [Rhodococcus jostii]